MERDLRKLRGRCFALDSQTARRVDENGFLHVDKNRLTCDQVAGYYGFELPKSEGANPEKIYYAYRPAEELQRALNSFNGVPLLNEHVFDYADAPQRDRRIGAIGDQASWESPFVTNSLTVWDKDAIEAIVSGKTRELSCGYHYRIDWTPGETPDGTHYDFVMRDIKCNHVALVGMGRADGCRVADSLPTEKEIRMNQDNKCAGADDFTAFSRKAIEGAGLKLSPEQVDALVKALAEAHAAFEKQAAENAAKETEGTRGAKDNDPAEKPAEKPAEPAKSEDPKPAEKAKDEGAKGDSEAKAADAQAQAIDAAVAKAVDAAKKSIADRYAAAEAVRPFAGALDPMKFETPEKVFQAGLKALDISGISDVAAPEVFRAIVAQRNAGIKPAAMDAAAENGLTKIINSL